MSIFLNADNLTLLEEMAKTMGVKLFDGDFYKLMYRFIINFFFVFVVVRFIYYPITKRKDYLFTYFLISLITFSLCFALKKLDINMGMGLGLFAIFGIIRYRTDAIEIKEMTYLFIVIGLSVVNSLAGKKISFAEILFINTAVVVITFLLEYVFLLKHQTRKVITYEKIELIKPEKYDEMLADLQDRTGLNIVRFEVGKIDFLRDTANVKIFFFEHKQENYQK
jgi:hypothetical protein